MSECVGASLGGVCAVSLMCIASELPYGSLEARWSLGKEPIIQIFTTSYCANCSLHNHANYAMPRTFRNRMVTAPVGGKGIMNRCHPRTSPCQRIWR